MSLAAVTELTANAIKVANALKDRLDKAPKAPSPELVEKAANALISGEWVKEAQKENAKAALSDPTRALEVLTELATKASEAIDAARTVNGLDPRLAAGTASPPAETTKPAGDTSYVGERVENEADRDFTTRILQYRQMMSNDQG